MDENIRADHATQLLDNPIFQEALEQVNKAINVEMDKVSPTDKETALALIHLRQAANRIIQHIINVASSPKVTEFNAKQKRKFF